MVWILFKTHICLISLYDQRNTSDTFSQCLSMTAVKTYVLNYFWLVCSSADFSPLLLLLCIHIVLMRLCLRHVFHQEFWVILPHKPSMSQPNLQQCISLNQLPEEQHLFSEIATACYSTSYTVMCFLAHQFLVEHPGFITSRYILVRLTVIPASYCNL